MVIDDVSEFCVIDDIGFIFGYYVRMWFIYDECVGIV